MPFFTSIADTREQLARTGYLVDEALATVVYLGDALGKLGEELKMGYKRVRNAIKED